VDILYAKVEFSERLINVLMRLNLETRHWKIIPKLDQDLQYLRDLTRQTYHC